MAIDDAFGYFLGFQTFLNTFTDLSPFYRFMSVLPLKRILFYVSRENRMDSTFRRASMWYWRLLSGHITLLANIESKYIILTHQLQNKGMILLTYPSIRIIMNHQNCMPIATRSNPVYIDIYSSHNVNNRCCLIDMYNYIHNLLSYV